MKTIILKISLFVLLVSPLANADYKDEIAALTKRVQELADSEAGLSSPERFKELVDGAYNYTMLNYPEFATYLGDPRGQDRWTDQSESATRQREKDARTFLAALENIDRAGLSATEQVNYDLLYDQQKRDVEGQVFPGDFMPLNQMSGVQQSIARMMTISQPKNAKDYANMISRLEKTPEVVDQTIAWMRKGMEAGITPPAITLRDVPQQIRNQLVDEADQKRPRRYSVMRLHPLLKSCWRLWKMSIYLQPEPPLPWVICPMARLGMPITSSNAPPRI